MQINNLKNQNYDYQLINQTSQVSSLTSKNFLSGEFTTSAHHYLATHTSCVLQTECLDSPCWEQPQHYTLHPFHFVSNILFAKQHPTHKNGARLSLVQSYRIAVTIGQFLNNQWLSLVRRRSKNRREHLVHTVYTCAAPQAFLGNLETSIKSTPLH